MKSRYAWLVLAVALAAGLFLWTRPKQQTAPPTAQAAKPALRVAVNLPLSGPIAVFMSTIPEALLAGIAAAGPTLKVQYNIQDNAGTPSGAVSAFRLHNQQGFDIYVSGSSEMSSAVVKQVDELAKPHFLVAFDAFIVERGKNRLRVLPNYKLEAPLWVDAVRRVGAKTVSVVTLNNAPIEEEFAAVIIPQLSGAGMQVKRHRFEWEGTNYALAISEVESDHPDMILVSGYSVHLLPIIAELNRQKLNSIPIMMALDFVDLLHNGTNKSQLQHFLFMCPDFELRERNSPATRWAEDWEKKHGSSPTYPAAYAYDMGQLIAHAAATGLPTHATLLQAQPFQGVTGTIKLDTYGDLVSTLSVCKLGNDFSIERAWP